MRAGLSLSPSPSSWVVPWQNYRLYLHHWFLAGIVGKVFKVKGFYSFPYVSILQEIYRYGDCYRIIKKGSAEFGARDVISCGE